MSKSQTKFNEKLDRKIQEAGLTIGGLSQKAGISATTLSGIVNGQRLSLHPRTISRICRVLNCKPGDIFEKEGNI